MNSVNITGKTPWKKAHSTGKGSLLKKQSCDASSASNRTTRGHTEENEDVPEDMKIYLANQLDHLLSKSVKRMN